MKCPVCDGGLLLPQVQEETIEYKGRQIDIQDFFHVCEACGTEAALPKDIKESVRSIHRAKKMYDGMLLGEEIQAILDHYGITQAQAAEIFGGGPVAFSKYKKDDVCQNESMDKLLRLADNSSDIFYKLVSMSGVKITRPELDATFSSQMHSDKYMHAQWLEEIDSKVAFGKFSIAHVGNTCCNDGDYADAA